MKRTWTISLVLAFVALVLFCIPAAWGQATTSLRGTVSDASGATIPNAQVSLANSATDYVRETTTGKDGAYELLQLPPATYSLTVTAQGFKKYEQGNITMLVATPYTINVKMEVGEVSQTVTVEAAAVPINTSDATLGNAYGSLQINSLPFDGLDPTAILSLQTGVSYIAPNPNGTSQMNDSRSGAVNGARSDQSNITVDGVDNNDQLNGLAFQGALRTTLASTEEFRVTTANGNADQGRSSGAQVSLITKSGTNDFHGTLYEYNRNILGRANNWFNKFAEDTSGLPNHPGSFIRNVYGGALGGPVLKDRLFFFFNYEALRKSEAAQVTQTVPSDSMRDGVIIYACANPASCPGGSVNGSSGNPHSFPSGFNGLTPAQIAQMDPDCAGVATSTPGFGCPAGPGVNPAVMTLLNTYPHFNSDAVGDGFNIRGFTFASGNPERDNTSIGRLDYNLTRNGNQRLFLRGELQDDKTSGTAQFPGQPPSTVFLNGSRGLVAAYTAVLSGNKINAFHYGFIRQSLGNIGANDTQHHVILRGLTSPTAFTRSSVTIIPVHNFIDDFTLSKGAHTIQFGGNFRVVSNIRSSFKNSFNDGFANGGFLAFSKIANSGQDLDPGVCSAAPHNWCFPAVATSFGNSYDFPMVAMAGLVSEFDAIYNKNKAGNFLAEGTPIARHFRDLEFEPYVQDSWRIKSNLTLNFGIRYALLQPPYEVNGVQIAPTTSLDTYFHQRGTLMQQAQFLNVFNAPITFNLNGQANGKNPYWGWDYKDFAPRVSLAWSPNWSEGFLGKFAGGPGKLSIRGGWGIYFDHFGEGIVNTFDQSGSFGMTTQESNPAGVFTTDRVPRFIDQFTIPGQPGNPVCPSCSFVSLYGSGVAQPAAGFPNTPPAQGFAIAWGLDDKLKTPYSHAFDFSIERDLGHGFSLDSAYVGRLGRRLLENLDLAMPEDVVDPASGEDYFKAATALIQAFNAGTDINSIPTSLAGGYWEHQFPLAAGQPSINVSQFGGTGGCAPGTYPASPTATQAMYDAFACFGPNETTTLQFVDDFCAPACAGSTSPTPGLLGQQFTFFQGQYASLYSWGSIGTSDFHAGEWTLRKKFSQGYTFDLNYTYSKSMDEGSLAERLGLFGTDSFDGFSSSEIINSWNPRLQRSVSDWDTKHQINMNWVAQIPVGKGRHFGSGMNRAMDAIVGGWQLSGLYRWTSGFPFSVGDGFNFPTNWELTGNAVQIGSTGGTGAFFDTIPGSTPAINVFKNPTQALAAFRFAYPGEVGVRNTLRGPGLFNIDMGLRKEWNLGESRKLQLDWQTFNITNSYRFDPFTALPTIDTAGTFGNFSNELQDERKMQFGLRFDF
ncbi:MAG TPA: carboxypeptidase-like regulatory domain-containing protein [Candidatus Acidoferrales bacterium]|nr:carboxypeptidase-like regulatory domain-containing protein [Candidatus Acidoferrales bacterium]